MRPMPGQLNTCSTITAPPSRNGILALMISVTGIRKPSLNAWRHTGAPLARAVRVLAEDYIRTARAKGARGADVVFGQHPRQLLAQVADHFRERAARDPEHEDRHEEIEPCVLLLR